MFDRAKAILELSYIKNIPKIPDYMKKQKILCEFARDAALHIIASQPSDAVDCEVCGTYRRSGDRFCRECGKLLYG